MKRRGHRHRWPHPKAAHHTPHSAIRDGGASTTERSGIAVQAHHDVPRALTTGTRA
jgi:hypothetical protein